VTASQKPASQTARKPASPKPVIVKQGDMSAKIVQAGKKWTWEIVRKGERISFGANNSQEAAQRQVEIRFQMFDRQAASQAARAEREAKQNEVKASRQAAKDAKAASKTA
jgi:hypothetical protein